MVSDEMQGSALSMLKVKSECCTAWIQVKMFFCKELCIRVIRPEVDTYGVQNVFGSCLHCLQCNHECRAEVQSQTLILYSLLCQQYLFTIE